MAVNMGYGHERPAHVLRHLSVNKKVVIANDYDGIPERDKSSWEGSRSFYEKISRFKSVPVVGDFVFKWTVDEMQRIPAFYPRRDLSAPSTQLNLIYSMIRRRKWVRHLVESLAEKNPVPLLCTFMTPAFAAEEFGYPNDIYVLVTDSDMSRAWVAKDPKKSRIRYFAPTGRVAERLKLYGVPAKNVFLTGFALPTEAVGGLASKTLMKNLGRRICKLDPHGIFLNQMQSTISQSFGPRFCSNAPGKRKDSIKLAFAVGGAGAQREIGTAILRSLAADIKRGRIEYTFVVGNRPEVKRYFEDAVKKARLKVGKGVHLLYEETRPEYFASFTKLVQDIDILWTKPSELSFYTGLGLPIIMAPTVGSQEDYNHKWLEQVGGGIDQLDPRYTNEWLFDWINSGALAKKAWNGFIEAPTHGAYRIEDVISGRGNTIHPLPMVV